jgi:hypothetical protein
MGGICSTQAEYTKCIEKFDHQTSGDVEPKSSGTTFHVPTNFSRKSFVR